MALFYSLYFLSDLFTPRTTTSSLQMDDEADSIPGGSTQEFPNLRGKHKNLSMDEVIPIMKVALTKMKEPKNAPLLHPKGMNSSYV